VPPAVLAAPRAAACKKQQQAEGGSAVVLIMVTSYVLLRRINYRNAVPLFIAYNINNISFFLFKLPLLVQPARLAPQLRCGPGGLKHGFFERNQNNDISQGSRVELCTDVADIHRVEYCLHQRNIPLILSRHLVGCHSHRTVKYSP